MNGIVCFNTATTKTVLIIIVLLVHRKLHDNGLNEEQVESFLETVDLHSFRHGLKAEEFVNLIHNVSVLSDNLGIPIDKLSEYINQQNEKVKEVKEELVDAEMREMDAKIDCHLTMDKLCECETNRPTTDIMKTTQRQLEELKMERDYLDDEISRKDREIHRLEYERLVPVDQLVVINKNLNTRSKRILRYTKRNMLSSK